MKTCFIIKAGFFIMKEDFDSVYVTDFSEENYTAALIKKQKKLTMLS